MDEINDEVSKNGNFLDLYDFSQRLDASILSKKNLEFLTYSGAFDTIEKNRNKVYQSINILSSISNAAMEKTLIIKIIYLMMSLIISVIFLSQKLITGQLLNFWKKNFLL